MLEVQHGFIVPTTNMLAYIQRVTGRPNSLSLLIMQPKSEIVQVLHLVFKFCTFLGVTIDDFDSELLIYFGEQK